MRKLSKFLAIFLIVAGTAFFAASKAQAVTANCIFSSPIQQVVISGFAHMCGADRPLCNYDKVASGIGECCAGFDIILDGYTDCVKAGPSMAFDINTVFAVEAWDSNHDTWSVCSYQDASLTELNAYCKSKGYARVWPTEKPCYKAGSVIRYAWNGLLPMVPGSSAGLGIGLMTVKCSTTGYCTENWSCGSWSLCLADSLQTRTCSDINNCGSTVDKPAVSQTCVCTPNWICEPWSTCFSNQQTRLCSDFNNCDTTSGKPAETQSCGCIESWSCDSWSTCSGGGQTRTCSDANSCGTTVTKPAVSQSCSCTESWSCDSWSTCSGGGQTRTCSDANSCGTVVDKPAASQSCDTTCTESWSCDSWSTCSGGGQTRICTDAYNCGTTIIKPLTSQSCSDAVPNPITMDISCPSLQAGDMIKVTGKAAIYVLNSELETLYFPNGDVFKSWRPTYGGYYSITQACFDSLEVPAVYPGGVNFRPGSYVVKRASSDQLYVVEPNNTLAKITPAIATSLYGISYKVMTVDDPFWPHYVNRAVDVVTAVPHPGMLTKVGAVTYYVDMDNKLREVTTAGMTANEFQTTFVRTLSATAISDLIAGEDIATEVPTITDKTQ